MTVKRKTKSNRRRVKRKTSGGVPAWFWLLGGILIGLGLALVLMFRGYLPELKQHMPSVDTDSSGSADSAYNHNNQDDDGNHFISPIIKKGPIIVYYFRVLPICQNEIIPIYIFCIIYT